MPSTAATLIVAAAAGAALLLAAASGAVVVVVVSPGELKSRRRPTIHRRDAAKRWQTPPAGSQC